MELTTTDPSIGHQALKLLATIYLTTDRDQFDTDADPFDLDNYIEGALAPIYGGLAFDIDITGYLLDLAPDSVSVSIDDEANAWARSMVATFAEARALLDRLDDIDTHTGTAGDPDGHDRRNDR